MPFDIAVNITDDQYLGKYYSKDKQDKEAPSDTKGAPKYYSKEKHPCDIHNVIERAQNRGIQMVFLGTSFKTSVESVFLAEKYKEYSSVGVHPGSAEECSEEELKRIEDIFKDKSLLRHKNIIGREYKDLINRDAEDERLFERIVAVGEVGLDYYRDYSSKNQQKKIFRRMLDLSSFCSLPYIFHYRECKRDFLELVDDYSLKGVVHSFTGTLEEARILLKKGYYIGVNGASIRENIRTHVIEEIPLDRLLVETDAPWCSIRRSSSYHQYAKQYLKEEKIWTKDTGMKGRNEPVNLEQVIDVLSVIKDVSRDEIVEITDKNFQNLFLIK